MRNEMNSMNREQAPVPADGPQSRADSLGDRIFMVVTVILCLLLTAALVLQGARYLNNRDAILLARAEEALSAGDEETVLSLCEEIEDEEAVLSLQNRLSYNRAKAALDAGRYEEALAAFTALGNFMDAPQLISECRYALACAAFEAGDYVSAEDLFRSISGYQDAAERCRESIRCRAEALEEAGAHEEAITLLLTLEDDASVERATAIAMEVTGLYDGGTALNLVLGLTDEDVARRASLKAYRAQLPKGRIAAGFYHCVGLKNDGTVLAAGDDSFGQCGVSGWTEIVAVAAGGYHTVALKSDGTVLAAGRNTEGQCNVTDWTEVTAIACGDYGTLGLRKDGTVLHCGYQEWTAADNWSGVSAVNAGSYMAVAVVGGKLLGTHPSAAENSFTGIIDCDCSTGYAIGLTEDGTVLCTDYELPWENVAAFCADPNSIYGLTDQGEVLCFRFRDRTAAAVEGISDGVAIASDATQLLVLHADGAVTRLTFGHHDPGAADVSAWNLFE